MKKTPKPAAVLRNVYDLFSNKKRWVQGAYAQEASGVNCSERSKNAVCWCMMGGIHHFVPNSYDRAETVEVLETAIRRNGFKPRSSGSSAVINFNDQKGRTIQQIRKVLKTAIKLADAAA